MQHSQTDLSLYLEYMYDYIESLSDEGFDELDEYLLEALDKGKEGIYKENYYMRDHLQIPYITKVLSKPENREKIIEFTGKIMDEHVTELSTSGPVYSFTFGTKEAAPLLEIFNITNQEIIDIFDQMVVETYYGKVAQFVTTWVHNSPHKILITAILIDALQHGYDDIVECCEYLWAFSEYALIYRIFWKPPVNVKEDVMNYTIEHLGTKFQVKKVKNIKELLKYDAHSSVTKHKEKLIRGVDNAYHDLMLRMRSQIKGKFRNISNAYFQNIKTNASQHMKKSQFDDGTLSDQEGHTTIIAQTVDNTISRMATGGVNNAIARVTAEGSAVDKDNLVSYLNQIQSSRNNGLPKFIETLITAYFVKYPTSTTIGDGEFTNFALALYRSIAISKDGLYMTLRQILDHWMYNIIDIKSSYSSSNTVISYTRAIYNYMVLMINHYN